MKLHFILADTYATECAVVFDGEHVPYKKRIVTVELTPDQLAAIQPRKVGMRGENEVYEELLDVILER